MSRKKTREDGTLRPAVRRSRSKRSRTKRAAWLAQFRSGDRERFFLHVRLDEAIFLSAFERETGLDRFEAAELLEEVANERGWRKLRTLDRTVVGIAPPRRKREAAADEAFLPGVSA